MSEIRRLPPDKKQSAPLKLHQHPAAFPEEAEPEISYPLDLNAATAEELETLPGVLVLFVLLEQL